MAAPRQSWNNRLLRGLPAKERALLSTHLEPFDLVVGDLLYRAGEPLRHAVFPESGIIALLTSTREGRTIDIGMVGNEGLFGKILMVDTGVAPVSALVRGGGAGTRIEASEFRLMLVQCPALAARVQLFSFAQMAQIIQTTVCNASHSMESRVARLMLAFSGRMGADHFELTQEHLADMLGVRRAGINHAARKLLGQGLIDYSRGQIRVVDRAGLVGAACSCHALMETFMADGS
jgi:CRP-like cAMP-binding protein